MLAYRRDFAAVYDIVRSHKDYRAEADRLHDLLRDVYLVEQGARVLDVGCGTGSHAVRLQELGFLMTGIDPSRDMIDVALRKRSPVKFESTTIDEFPLVEFDAIISLSNVINCLGSEEKLRNFLQAMEGRLRRGGVVLIECWNGSAVMREAPEKLVRTFETGDERIERVVVPDWQMGRRELRLTYDITVTGMGTGTRRQFRVLHDDYLFTPDEIVGLMGAVGLAEVEVRTPLPDYAIATGDERMLAIAARKP